MQIYHPFVTIFTEELIMHSNSNCLLCILFSSHNVSLEFFWMENVTSSTNGPLMNHFRSSNIPCICSFSFLPCCWVHTWFDWCFTVQKIEGDEYCGDDKDRCTEGPLAETNGLNTKELKLYITDKHEHLEQGHIKWYVHGLSDLKLQIKWSQRNHWTLSLIDPVAGLSQW